MNTLVVCEKCEKVNRVPLDRAKSAQPVCGSCHAPLSLHGAIQDVTGKTLHKLTQVSDRPVVVDFWASWCGPCRAFAPVFEQAANELADRFVFVKLNTEADPEATSRYQIRGIPALLLFKDGKELTRQAGAMPLDVFKNFLSQHARAA